MLGHIKIIGAVAVVALAFGSGWRANGWRLTSQYQAERLAAEEAVREAMIQQAQEVDRINRQTQQREASLVVERQLDQAYILELQHEINERPIVREEIRVPIKIDGVLECPSVPTVDWGVFQDFYNRAATGAATTDSPNARDAIVRPIADDTTGSGSALAD